MKYYDKNVDCLKKYKPDLYNKLAVLKELIVEDNIESLDAKDGNKYIQIQKDNKVYKLNSNYNPIEQSKRWAEQFKLNDMYQVILMFGLGNGMFVRELLNKIIHNDTILIYEPSKEIFIHALKNYDLSDIITAKNTSITVEGVNDLEFHNTIQNAIYWINLHSQTLCQHPYFIDLFEISYIKFLKEIKAQNERTILNRNTVGYLGMHESNNTISNIRYILESNTVMELGDKIPKNTPVFIVAAGPSLEKNIEDLKLAKGKSIIISTDRAFDYLLNHNIEPDFVITLDPIKPLKYFTTRANIKIPLMYRMEANNEILDFHKGRKFIYDADKFIKTLYDKLNRNLSTLSTGGSVATAAFSVCLSLGFERIILVGQDLAYGENDLTHAGEKEDGIKDSEIILVPGINGGMIKTRYDWNSFINWFQDAIAYYNKVDVIDATEGGAKIEGSNPMKLKDAIDKYCIHEIDCNKIVHEIAKGLTDNEISIVYEYINTSLEDLIIIKNSIKKLIEVNEKLIIENKRGNDNAAIKLINRMSKFNKVILEKDIYSLLDNYISKNRTDELSNIYKLTGDETKDREITYLKSKQIYQSIFEIIDDVKNKLQGILFVIQNG